MNPKKIKSVFIVRVPAMNATAKAPLGPTLGQYGIAIAEFCNSFNKMTVNYEDGSILNTKVILYDDFSYEINVMEPYITSILMNVMHVAKGSGKAGKYRLNNSLNPIGFVTTPMLYEIAKYKYNYLDSNIKKFITLLEYYKSIVGTVKSMGCLIIKRDRLNYIMEI
jgi:large subunit ribosomal protein L11